jgi:hypothetical membrane protein
VCALLAMSRYPGGTQLDAHTVGYTFDRNFLSDLGMTVAYDGRGNALGSALFVLSMGAMVIGFGSGLWPVIRSYAARAESRRAAQAALIAALVVCVAFVGVALTPEDRVMGWHVRFTRLAFQVAPLVPTLMTVAAAREERSARGTVAAWGLLAMVMLAYALLITFGPPTSTADGLRTMVLAQKAVTLVAGGLLLVVCARVPSAAAPSRGTAP